MSLGRLDTPWQRVCTSAAGAPEPAGVQRVDLRGQAGLEGVEPSPQLAHTAGGDDGAGDIQRGDSHATKPASALVGSVNEPCEHGIEHMFDCQLTNREFPAPSKHLLRDLSADQVACPPMSDVAVEAPSASPDGESVFRVVGLAVVVGLVVGMATSPAQGWLSDATRSLSNSAGPWSLAAFARRPSLAAACPRGAARLDHAGDVRARIRDRVGTARHPERHVDRRVLDRRRPPGRAAIGIAAAWTKGSTSQWRIGAGYGVVAGALIGEAVYGLTQIRDTTEPAYWVLEALCGVAVIVFVAVRHPHLSSVASMLAVASAAAVVVYLAAISV